MQMAYVTKQNVRLILKPLLTKSGSRERISQGPLRVGTAELTTIIA